MRRIADPNVRARVADAIAAGPLELQEALEIVLDLATAIFDEAYAAGTVAEV